MPAMLVRSRSGHGLMRTPSETDRNGSEAAHVARVHVAELVLVHAVDREAAVPLLERDARLEARERRAQAQVAPVAQRELALDLAVDVERVGVGELAVVAARGAGHEDHA